VSARPSSIRANEATEEFTMRLLVIGGAGYIGSFATRLFQHQGHAVWVYDNLSAGHRAAVPGDSLIVGDLADTSRLEQVLRQHRIEAVVHFAALTLVGESVREPARYYRNNLVCTLGLMESLRHAGVGKVVFSSTCATYGLPGQVPITEEELQNPINPYGNTKLAVELALKDYAAAYGWGVAILRYFNAAGASADGSLGEDHQPETHLIPLVIQAALGLRPAIEVFGTDYPTADGTCIRDYIHVEDLADAHSRALQRLAPGQVTICNLGTGGGFSVREVIRAVEEISGRKVPVREGPRRPGDPPVLLAAPERAREVLGWTPCYTDLRDIVETAWRWHSQHPHGYEDRARPSTRRRAKGRALTARG
jgi:UDP-glucose-4-epimerase GalE